MIELIVNEEEKVIQMGESTADAARSAVRAEAAAAELEASLDKIDEINEKFFSWEGVPGTIYADRYYRQSDGTAITGNSNYRAGYFPYDETKTYRYSTGFNGGAGQLAGIVFFGADGTTAIGRQNLGNGDFQLLEDIPVNAPSGTQFVAINAAQTNSSQLQQTPQLEVLEETTMSTDGTMMALLKNINAKVDWVVRTPDRVIADVYYLRDGSTKLSSNYTLEEYDINGTELGIDVSLMSFASNVANITYLDGSGNVIGIHLPGKSGNILTRYTRERLDFPKTARKIAISSRGEDHIILRVKEVVTNSKKFKLPLVFGDSITNQKVMGTGSTPASRTNEEENSWVSYTMPRVAEDWRNYAEGGASFMWRESNVSSDPYKNGIHQVNQAIAADEDHDMVIFALGTNDLNLLSSGTGTVGDYATAMSKGRNSLDNTVLYEAIRICLHDIAEKWPKATRFIMTPIQSSSANRIDANAKAWVLPAIKQMGGAYCFEVIDQYDQSGIVREFEDATNDEGGAVPNVDTGDGTHPVETVGYRQGIVKMSRLATARIRARLLGF